MRPNTTRGIVNKHNKGRTWKRLLALFSCTAILAFFCIGQTSAHGQTYYVDAYYTTGGITDPVSSEVGAGGGVSIAAIAQPGYSFDGWTILFSEDPNTNFTDLNDANLTVSNVQGNVEVQATFNLIEYTLTTNISGGFGTGTLTVNPLGPYHYGDTVTLTAVPGTGEEFTGWSGGLSVTPTGSNSGTITISSDPAQNNVTANFNFIEYTLDVTSTGGTGGSTNRVNKNPDQATYHDGDVVTLTANPQAGETFASWSGDLAGNAGNGSPETITIDGNKSVTASFDFIEYTLDVSMLGTGNGSVNKNPDQATYHYGDVVTLTANAAPDSVFIGFEGAVDGVTSIDVTIDSNKVVSALFQRKRALVINNPGTGTGTVNVVSSDPSTAEAAGVRNIPAGGDLVLNVAQNDTVILNTLTADADSVLIESLTSLIDPEEIIMGAADETRTATFELKRTLTVTNPGSGSGTVTVDSCVPSGEKEGQSFPIGPSQSIFIEVAQNDSVVISAASSTDVFEGFNGDNTGATPISPPIVMNGDQSVTATFKAEFFLTINWIGGGPGTVNVSRPENTPRYPFVPQTSTGSAPHSFSVGCLEGDVLRLEAVDTYPEQGSRFKGWGGDAGGTDATIEITMNTSKTVTVEFKATYTLAISKDGTGAGRADVTAGAGSVSSLPGGLAPGVYLYEAGDVVSLAASDNIPTSTETGSEFQNWTVDYGNPGAGFGSGSKNTSVTISGNLAMTGNFIGKYLITSVARTGGTITPLGDVIKYHGESQPYNIAASMSYVISDVVVDGLSQGSMADYTFNELNANHTIVAVFVSEGDVIDTVTAGDEQIYRASVPPMVLLVMGRDHKLYYEAYNDASDLDGDGALDVGYNPDIDYYGYFDSYKAYTYVEARQRFEPVRYTPDKKVSTDKLSGEWSGDFLNYLTMSRMDVMRKVLYGGYRSVDTDTETVLMRAYIPQDAHSWGKEYESIERDGYDIRDYAPLDPPVTEWNGYNVRKVRHLFANTTLGTGTGGPYLDQPLLRVLPDSIYRIWEWVSIERPVAGERCGHGGTGPACVTIGTMGGFHPGHPNNASQYQTLVDTYAVELKKYGEGPASQINGSGNPFGAGYSPYDQNHAQQNNYLTIFKGKLVVQNAGYYRFAVDGDDAVELLVNGTVRVGWYGGHGRCNCTSYQSPDIYLSSGEHVIEFRHEEAGGGDNYYLHWRGPDSGNNWQIIPASKYLNLTQATYRLITDATPESLRTDYHVKVLVCDPTLPEPNSKQYPSGVYKPTGLLQKFGEPGKMNFGLLTGSYTKNISGGVLRKTVGPITDEIDANTGRFAHKYDSNVQGIVKTIDNFRVTGFTYDGYYYNENCGWITTRPINEAECRMWGNPIAEMMYEGLRYFAGEGSATADFTYGTGSTLDDNKLGLPVAAWDDPFVTNDACAKPFMLVISDINPSYDSIKLPGVNPAFGAGLASALTSFDPTPVAFHAQDMANAISTEEGGLGNHYIGQAGATYDGSCAPKDLSAAGFGDIRGLCPEEPTKQGSYYAAAVARFGRTHNISSAEGEQNVITYAVALASPLPRIEIPVGNKTITMVPFAKSVGGSHSITPTTGAFQPTNTIVDFYVQFLTPTSGSFRINFEDVEQGADHDMDAIVIYNYQVVDDNDNPVSDPAQGTGVKITLQSEYAAGSIIQHMGYIISGTTADGTYLEVRDYDTAASNDVNFFLDTPPTGYRTGGVNGLPLSGTRTFTPGDTLAATLLKDPLWYAAKWGGFNDLNNNGIPDLESEWDADGDGVPDTYFYVVNPLKLEQQLTRSFADILSRGTSHVAPVVSVDEANRTQSGDKLYMAFFKPISDGYWQGNIKKYGLDFRARGDCGRDDPEWTVVDQFGEIAGDCDGLFIPSSRSFWSTENDGGYVDRGGVGERLLASMPGSDPVLPPTVGPYWDFRNIYTYKGAVDGSMVRFIHGNISNADLNVGEDYARFRIINFMYGYTYDSKATTNSDPKEKRQWILGDIIHSEPRIIDYIHPTDSSLDYRYIVVSANDGMLHVFDDATGNELFAFIPPDLLPRLQEFSSATPTSTCLTVLSNSSARRRRIL
jgi:Tfp pilus tip-associated adhesin PilY1